MRILSKFKDYYDTAVIDHHLDSATIYLREETPGVDIRPHFLSSQHHIARSLSLTLRYEKFPSSNQVEVEIIPIGFCDKIYFSFCHEGLYGTDIDTMIELISIKLGKKVCRVFNENSKRAIKDCSIAKEVITESLLRGKYFDRFSTPYYVVRPYTNVEGRAQVMLVSNYNSLQQLKFTRIFTACQAYQEIEMYLNSRLTKPDSAAQITDSNVLLIKKGFDSKTSFRHPIKL